MKTDEQRRKHAEYMHKWYWGNHDHMLDYNRRYCARNRERINARERERRKTDPGYVMRRKRIAAKIKAKDRERYLRKKRESYQRCKLQHTASVVDYRRRHPEMRKAVQTKYRKKHKEEIRKKSREYYHRKSKQVLATSNAWKRRNPVRVLDMTNRRRARKVKATIEKCANRIAFLKLMPFCQYCFTLIDGTPTIDHIVPLSRGGKHAKSNLLACCLACNSSKGTKLPSEWSGRLLKEAA